MPLPISLDPEFQEPGTKCGDAKSQDSRHFSRKNLRWSLVNLSKIYPFAEYMTLGKYVYPGNQLGCALTRIICKIHVIYILPINIYFAKGYTLLYLANISWQTNWLTSNWTQPESQGRRVKHAQLTQWVKTLIRRIIKIPSGVSVVLLSLGLNIVIFLA